MSLWNNLFGLRWIRTPKAKIIFGLSMLALAIFTLGVVGLKDSWELIIILTVGGLWQIVTGRKKFWQEKQL